MSADVAELQALQAALVALKAAHGKALRLHKATPAESPDAPFPIEATLTVAAPEAAANYDIDSLQVRRAPHTQEGRCCVPAIRCCMAAPGAFYTALTCQYGCCGPVLYCLPRSANVPSRMV